ncbi:MAG: FGGY-family carbohydrate kinase [Shinella sp.]|nr:FGGY-family carbohydrate kinase [Shinella sp.]
MLSSAFKTGFSMGTYFIGLDAGSTLCKAAIFDLAGHQISEASRRTPMSRPKAGWCELDPDICWHAVIEVVTEAFEVSGLDASEIRGIGISAAMVGAWVVDAEGNALRPGVNWEDSRSQTIIDRMIAEDSNLMSRIFRSSGSVMQQGCTLPVLAWLVQNEPEVISRAAYVMSYKDFIRMKLTGLAATDRSEAAVIPGSAEKRWRSAEMVTLFGLDGHAHLLPPIFDSETTQSGLTAEAAAMTGLAEGLPVAIGAGDVAATVIGAGGLAAGTATAVLGTTCMVGVCHDRPVFTPPDLGLLFSLPGDVWYRSMVNVAGTLNLDWAIRALAPDLADAADRYAQVTSLVSDIPIGARDLTYLPYLSESGIIAPVVSPDARAQFAGLTSRHGRAELFRAVFEGVALALRDLFDALEFEGDQVVLTGGGSQSPFWSQMIADVLQKKVIVPSGTQFGARGAALLIATALKHFPEIRAASRSVCGGSACYHPDIGTRTAYEVALRRYRDHRDRLLGT